MHSVFLFTDFFKDSSLREREKKKEWERKGECGKTDNENKNGKILTKLSISTESIYGKQRQKSHKISF